MPIIVGRCEECRAIIYVPEIYPGIALATLIYSCHCDQEYSRRGNSR